MPNDTTPSPRRRSPARTAPIAVTAFLLLTVAAALWANGRREATLPGQDAPSRLEIAPRDEPGQRLIVRGQVLAPDGETPVAGVVLYVYQTDTGGRYGRAPGQRAPRLRGWLRTDAEGRYEYRTIRPGSYPSRSQPAHIHTQLWGAGYEPQWGTDLLFADDPLLPERELERARAAGRFGHVCAPERTEQEALVCVHDLRLESRGDRFEDSVRHGLRGPRRVED